MKKCTSLVYLLLSVFSLFGQEFSELSYGTDRSFEFISWNIQFFPINDQVTVDYLSDAIPALDADIIAFQEIANVGEFYDMINELPDYQAFVGSTDDLVKLAFVYKTDLVEVTNIYEIYTEEEYWLPFLRRPLVMECTMEEESFIVINNHFKALGDGILDLENPEDEENRRWVATNLLKEYIDINFPEDKVVVLGDLNDLLTDDDEHNVFQSILEDSENYAFADYSLAIGDSDDWSYPSWPSHLDHIIISNEIFQEFYAHSSDVTTLAIEEELMGSWTEYASNISDHRPVALKLFTDESLIFNKDFEDQSLISGAWTAQTISGTQSWYVPETQFGHNNTYCGYMNGFDNGAQVHESWFISPEFSPESYDDLRLSFWNTSGFSGPPLELLWSNDFSGDVQSANWTTFEGVNWHEGIDFWEWTFSGILDLSSLTGNSAHIAFKYTSTSDAAAAWELDDIVLSNAPNVKDINTAVSPIATGLSSGDGAYIYGDPVQVSALAAENYSFMNWTVDGAEVSTDSQYSFRVGEDMDLTANFLMQTTVEESADSFGIVVYPNPTRSELRIRVDEQNHTNRGTEIQLYDQWGKRIPISGIRTNMNEIILDLNGIAPGLYLVQVLLEGGVREIVKLIIMD